MPSLSRDAGNLHCFVPSVSRFLACFLKVDLQKINNISFWDEAGKKGDLETFSLPDVQIFSVSVSYGAELSRSGMTFTCGFICPLMYGGISMGG